MRVTVIVPEALMAAANHTHVLLGKAKDVNSYTAANWQDADGNLYAVSSGTWTDTQISGVTDPAVLQAIIAEGNVPEVVDMALVLQAQAAFSLVEHDDERDPPALTGIVAIPGDNPQTVLSWAGVSRAPEEI